MKTSFWSACALTVLAGCGGAAMAATPPGTANLTSFVQNPTYGATPLQQATGVAVQKTCAQLGTVGARSTQQQELFLRCNEMVETARSIQAPGCTPPNDDCTGVDRSLGLNAGGLLAAVQQVSGEELAAQGSLTTQVSSGQFANISGRISALRFGARATAARGRVAALQDSIPDTALSRTDLLALREVQHHPALEATDFGLPSRYALPALGAPADSGSGGGGGSISETSPWGWFLEGSYNFGDHDQTVNEDGFDFDASSASLGVDYNFGSAVFGASIGYDNYSADFDTNALVSGGKVEVKGASASLFGAIFGETFSLSGIVSYGKPDSDVTRNVVYSPAAGSPGCPTSAPCPAQSRTLTGSPDGEYLAAGVTLGYSTHLGSWDLEPSLSYSYRDVDVDGYSESDSLAGGGLALSYASQSIKSSRAIVGLQLSKSFSRGFGILTPNFRAEWHHEFEDDARTLSAKYSVEDTFGTAQSNFGAGCVSCFNFTAAPADSDFGVLGAGLSATLSRRLQGYVYLESLLGAANLTSNSIAVGIRGQF